MLRTLVTVRAGNSDVAGTFDGAAKFDAQHGQVSSTLENVKFHQNDAPELGNVHNHQALGANPGRRQSIT